MENIIKINGTVNPDEVDVDVLRAFAEAYTRVYGIPLTESLLDCIAHQVADNGQLYALPLDTAEGRAVAKMMDIPEQPSYTESLGLYKAYQVIVMNGNLYTMKPLNVKVA